MHRRIALIHTWSRPRMYPLPLRGAFGRPQRGPTHIPEGGVHMDICIHTWSRPRIVSEDGFSEAELDRSGRYVDVILTEGPKAPEVPEGEHIACLVTTTHAEDAY